MNKNSKKDKSIEPIDEKLAQARKIFTWERFEKDSLEDGVVVYVNPQADGTILVKIEAEEDGEALEEARVTKTSKWVGVDSYFFVLTWEEGKLRLREELEKMKIEPSKVEICFVPVSYQYQELYEKALDISSSKHLGQSDKAGKPYFGHPVRVADRCDSDEAIIVALMHDVLEDTEVTTSDLKEAGFPNEIIDALLSVTRRNDESYDEFVIRAAQHPIGRVVKKADLEDNMDIRRLESLNDGDVERLRKYLRNWHYLDSLDNSRPSPIHNHVDIDG